MTDNAGNGKTLENREIVTKGVRALEATPLWPAAV